MMGPFMQAAGPDGVISAEELVDLLTATGQADYPRKGGRFGLETCRLMIAMLDGMLCVCVVCVLCVCWG